MDQHPEKIEVQSPVETVNTPSENRPKLPRRRLGPALLGFGQSLLCLVGAVAIIWSAVGGIIQLFDTSELHEEFYYFLEPVLMYSPDEFEDVNETQQDALLNAAAFRLLQAEQIRMLREDDAPAYPVIDNSLEITAEEVTESYQTLFGKKAELTHRSVEESGLVYDEDTNCYNVPFESLNTGYRAIVFSSKKTLDGYKVRIGYVSNQDIQLDEHGNEIPPTEDMAAHFQTYTLKKSGDSYYIAACVNK